jgi:hypothetical protein
MAIAPTCGIAFSLKRNGFCNRKNSRILFYRGGRINQRNAPGDFSGAFTIISRLAQTNREVETADEVNAGLIDAEMDNFKG